MSQGRISYSRILFVGGLLFVLTGGGYVAGRFAHHASQPVEPAAKIAGKVSKKTALINGPSTLQQKPTVPHGLMLALRNAVTIVPEHKRPHPVVTRAKSDFSPVDVKTAGLQLALGNAVTMVPFSLRAQPVSNVATSRLNDLNRKIRSLEMALQDAISVMPAVDQYQPVQAMPGSLPAGVEPRIVRLRAGLRDMLIVPLSLKNHERASFVAKNEFSSGTTIGAPDYEVQSISPSAFRSPAEALWSKFGQPVWYVRPKYTGLRIKRAGSSEDESIRPVFGGLTEREFRTREVRCLAKAIYHEARGESQKGQFAVAQTIMNRVRAEFFPDTICGVIYENSHRRNKCQFSFACDGISDKPKDKKRWEIALDNARQVVGGKVWLDDIGYASHYHATYVRPNWRKYMNRIKRIGIHIFYRAKFMPLPEELALRMPKKDKTAN